MGCNSREFKNDLERANLKGNVKTVRRTPYEAIEAYGKITKGEIASGWVLFEVNNYNIYNKRGNIIESQDFYSSGELMTKTVYKYNNFNKIEEEIEYDSDGKPTKKTTFRYDEKENLIRKTEYKPDGSLIVKEIYKYNDKGEKIETQQINSDGVPDDKWIYKYNNKRERIETSRYKPDGSLHEKASYTYDNEGNLEEENRFGEEGNLEDRISYVFDNENNIIEVELQGPNGESEGTVFYRFNSKFNLPVINKYVYLLSEGVSSPLFDMLLFRGLGLEEGKVFNADGSLDFKAEYEYKFDEQDNWIKRIEFENDSAIFIVEREITYYEQGLSGIIDNLRDKFKL